MIDPTNTGYVFAPQLEIEEHTAAYVDLYVAEAVDPEGTDVTVTMSGLYPNPAWGFIHMYASK